MAKYILTSETKVVFGRHTLHRIQCTEAFSDVLVGDLGGFVESEANLSQLGLCWIYDDAMCFGAATVRDDAVLRNNSSAYDSADVYGSAEMLNNAEIYMRATAHGNATLRDDCEVFEDAEVSGNCTIGGSANIFQSGKVLVNRVVEGEVRIFGTANLPGGPRLRGNERIDT